MFFHQLLPCSDVYYAAPTCYQLGSFGACGSFQPGIWLEERSGTIAVFVVGMLRPLDRGHSDCPVRQVSVFARSTFQHCQTEYEVERTIDCSSGLYVLLM